MQQLPGPEHMERVGRSVSGGRGKLPTYHKKKRKNKTHTHSQHLPYLIKEQFHTGILSYRLPGSWLGRITCKPAVTGQEKPEPCTHPCITADFPHSQNAWHSWLRDVWEWQEFFEAEGVDRNRASMAWTHDLHPDQALWKARLEKKGIQSWANSFECMLILFTNVSPWETPLNQSDCDTRFYTSVHEQFIFLRSKRCFRGISQPTMTTLWWKPLNYVVQIKDKHSHGLLDRFILCKSKIGTKGSSEWAVC